MNIFSRLTARLNQLADLNHDGKVSRADLDAAVARMQEEAGALVTARGALGACVASAAVGCLVGSLVVAAVVRAAC